MELSLKIKLCFLQKRNSKQFLLLFETATAFLVWVCSAKKRHKTAFFLLCSRTWCSNTKKRAKLQKSEGCVNNPKKTDFRTVLSRKTECCCFYCSEPEGPRKKKLQFLLKEEMLKFLFKRRHFAVSVKKNCCLLVFCFLCVC